jgi:hypothetical protein
MECLTRKLSRNFIWLFFPFLASSLGTTGCDGITEPKLPAGAVPMQAPLVYGLWWEMTEACSGISGDLSSVRWYELPGATNLEVNGRTYQSYWLATGNRIVVAGRSRMAGPLIRHEMLHALTGPKHSREYFVDKCGGIVACEGQCLAEAGEPSAPPGDAATITPSDLDVAVDVTPAQAAFTSDSGWVAITVSAKNTRAYPVWVHLLPVGPGSSYSATFGYEVRCESTCGGRSAYAYVAADRMGFNPGQTRRYSFDLQLPPDLFLVRGNFNSDTTSEKSLGVMR